MTTEIATKENGFNLVAASMDTGELAQSIADIAGPEGLDPRMLPMIHAPAAGGDQWRMPDGDYAKTVEGVLIHWRTPRALFKTVYKPGNTDHPDCASDDSITGVGDPGGTCANCEFNKWASRKQFDPTTESNAKACAERRMLYVVRSGFLLPLTIQVSPGSITPFTRFALTMLDYGGAKFGHILEFGLERSGDYSQITFNRKAKLSDDEKAKVKAYADALTPYLDATPIRHDTDS